MALLVELLINFKITVRTNMWKYIRSDRSQGNNHLVNESVAEDTEMSIIRRSQQVVVDGSTIWPIVHQDSGLKVYKVQIIQELKPLDHLKRWIHWDENFLIVSSSETVMSIGSKDRVILHHWTIFFGVIWKTIT